MKTYLISESWNYLINKFYHWGLFEYFYLFLKNNYLYVLYFSVFFRYEYFFIILFAVKSTELNSVPPQTYTLHLFVGFIYFHIISNWIKDFLHATTDPAAIENSRVFNTSIMFYKEINNLLLSLSNSPPILLRNESA